MIKNKVSNERKKKIYIILCNNFVNKYEEKIINKYIQRKNERKETEEKKGTKGNKKKGP